MSAPTVVPVGDAYAVTIGNGTLAEVAHEVPERAERVLVVHSERHPGPARAVAAAVAASGRTAVPAPVPDAEAAKTSAVAAGLWQVLGQHAFTRTDAVVAVGGGAVTDLAGFVAATWLRGVPVVQVPTTLLAMVDAALGGKTGINTAEGKNLVGAFHPPVAVVCDLDVLATLPRADIAAGLAEVVKGGFIADPRILELVEADPAGAADPTSPVLRELVERKVAVKARVVAADLTEASLREILNYGHTFGHAIEQVEGYRRRHGEAVAIGMVFAAELAHVAGMLAPGVVARHRSVLASLGLPTAYPRHRWGELRVAMSRDKKTRGSRLRFVVLEDVGRPTRLEGPREEWLEAAYAAIGP